MMRDVEAALRALLQDAHPAVVAGAAKGLDSLIRNTGKVQSPGPETVSQLRAAITVRSDRPEGDFALARRLAWLALTAAGPVDVATVERGYEDPDFQVRRRAIATFATTEAPDAQRRALLSRALRDAAFQVRYEAVRTYSRTLQAQDCAPVISAIDDPSAHVSLAAIDALGNGCPAGPGPIARLVALCNELPKPPPALDPGSRPPDPGFPSTPWHGPAHALVALARVARQQATELMPAFADHPVWQVRMYAARAAAALADVAQLERLAADADDNTRSRGFVRSGSTRRTLFTSTRLAGATISSSCSPPNHSRDRQMERRPCLPCWTHSPASRVNDATRRATREWRFWRGCASSARRSMPRRSVPA
jgi:hypothetical protein